MDWMQFIIFCFSTLGLFFWNRAQSRSDFAMMREDWRRMDAKLDEMKNEMKDFHGRLCTLEERYLNWIMRDK